MLPMRKDERWAEDCPLLPMPVDHIYMLPDAMGLTMPIALTWNDGANDVLASGLCEAD